MAGVVAAAVAAQMRLSAAHWQNAVTTAWVLGAPEGRVAADVEGAGAAGGL